MQVIIKTGIMLGKLRQAQISYLIAVSNPHAKWKLPGNIAGCATLSATLSAPLRPHPRKIAAPSHRGPWDEGRGGGARGFRAH